MTTPSPDAAVRPAKTSDAEAMGAVHSTAWLTDYAHLLPARAGSVEPAALAQAWKQAVAQPPSPAHRVMVATAASRVVGFVAFGPSADADGTPDVDGEVFALVIHPADQRGGHGSRLLNASIDLLREGGFGTVRAWVPEPDRVRQAFLQDAGFALDGATRLLDAAGDGSTTVREVRLAANIEPSVGAGGGPGRRERGGSA